MIPGPGDLLSCEDQDHLEYFGVLLDATPLMNSDWDSLTEDARRDLRGRAERVLRVVEVRVGVLRLRVGRPGQYQFVLPFVGEGGPSGQE